MKHKHIKQYGFSPLIIILVIVALAIVGFVAWRVYDATRQATVSLDSVAKTSDNQSIPQSQSTDKDKNKEQKKIIIPGIDYEVSMPDASSDLVFHEERRDGTVSVFVSTASLVAHDPDCSAELGSPLGVISKHDGKYSDTYGNGAPGKPLVKQTANYYISYTGPQAACSDSPETNKLAETYLNDFRKALGVD